MTIVSFLSAGTIRYLNRASGLQPKASSRVGTRALPIAGTKRQTHQATERCAQCHTDTGVPINRPIDMRRHYVPGIGQYCRNCF
jgi:hypothetical protein